MSSSSIWSINRMLSGAITSGQSEPGSNGSQKVLHISQNSKTGASPSDGFAPYPCHSLCRDAISVFYSTPQLTGLYLEWVSGTVMWHPNAVVFKLWSLNHRLSATSTAGFQNHGKDVWKIYIIRLVWFGFFV